MSSSNSGSKRLSLRFKAGDHKLCFKTEYEDGTGKLENISAGGCALREVDISLTIDEKILLIINLDNQDDIIEAGAKVVRGEENRFAVQFTDISEENKQRIVKHFASVQRKQKS